MPSIITLQFIGIFIIFATTVSIPNIIGYTNSNERLNLMKKIEVLTESVKEGLKNG